MSDALQGLVQYGYVLLFLFVMAEQVGLPIPAAPVSWAWGRCPGPGA
jgi:hypothetical protein